MKKPLNPYRFRVIFCKLFVGVMLSVCTALAFAQSPPDKCWIHLDKPFYVSGEIIWYKVYFPEYLDDASLMVRSALVNARGEVIEEYYLKAQKHAAVNGYFKLPYDMSTGNYNVLITGTHRERHFPIRLAEASIPIFSDLASTTSTVKIDPPLKNPSPDLSQSDNLKVNIVLDQAEYHARMLVSAQIEVTDPKGNPVQADVSVSVHDQELHGPAGEGLTLIEGVNLPQVPMDSIIQIVGRLESPEGDGMYTPLLGLFSSSENSVQYTQTDPQGNFSLAIPDFWGVKSLQFSDFAHGDVRIRIPSFYSVNNSSTRENQLNIEPYLQRSRERKKIYQLTARVETPLPELETQWNPVEFKPDRRIRLEDYAPFPDIPTFFKDVATPLKFRLEKGETYYAKMFNPDPFIRTFYEGDPLFIIDGRIENDMDSIARMDIENLVQIDLFYYQNHLLEQFGALGLNGVVMITTNTSPSLVPITAADNLFSLSGIQIPTVFPALKANELERNRHTPFFKSQLYWNPSLKTDEQGQAEIKFLQSDDISTFRMEVVAQGKSGLRGYATVSYQVVWER